MFLAIFILMISFFGILFIVRNHLIYKKSIRIINYIYEKDSSSKYIRFYEISNLLSQDKTIENWDKMILQFWKPINSFYKNTQFEKL